MWTCGGSVGAALWAAGDEESPGDDGSELCSAGAEDSAAGSALGRLTDEGDAALEESLDGAELAGVKLESIA